MFEDIKELFANLLHNDTSFGDVSYFISLTALALVIISSLVLIALMTRYRGKRPLDITLLFREITFVLVIIRTFLFLFLGWSNTYVSTAVFIALFLSCVLTLLFVLQEHRQGRRVLGSGRG